MAIKTFYNIPTDGSSGNSYYGPSLDTLYESGGGFTFRSKDGDTSVIPLGSTINSVTFRLWMHYDSGLENKVRFCYLADYDKCSKSSSTDKYYYVGSSAYHHGNGDSYLKYFIQFFIIKNYNSFCFMKLLFIKKLHKKKDTMIKTQHSLLLNILM